MDTDDIVTRLRDYHPQFVSADFDLARLIDVPLHYITVIATDIAYYDEESRLIVESIAERNIPANCRVHKKYWTEFVGEGIWQLAIVYYEIPA